MKIKKEIYAYTGEKRILRAFEKTMYRDVTRGQFVYDTWTYAHDSSVPYEIVTREEILEDWKPKRAETFYYITTSTFKLAVIQAGYFEENNLVNIDDGNCFPTRELAEAKLSEIKTLLK